MALNDLIPWNRNRPVAPARFAETQDPFFALHREMDRLFDDFTRGFGFPALTRPGWSSTWPQVEVTETDAEIKVAAELPGMEQKDVEVSLRDGVLTLRGEKKAGTDGATYSERWHGQFQRAIQVSPEVDPDRVSAAFRNGVLTITLGKRPEAVQQVKRIPISSS